MSSTFIKKTINLLLLTIIVCLISGCSKTNSVESEIKNIIENSENYSLDVRKYYASLWADGKYSYWLYNKEHEVVKSGKNLPREMDIMMCNDYTVKLSLQSGTGISARGTFYYNIENDLLSETYYSVLSEFENLVAYANYNKIIVRDIYDENVFYQEITEFKYMLSDMIDPFVEARFSSDGKSIEITYYSNDDYEQVSEAFELIKNK